VQATHGGQDDAQDAVEVPKVQQAPLIDSNLSPIIFKNSSLLGNFATTMTAAASTCAPPPTGATRRRTCSIRRPSSGLPSLDSDLEGVEDQYLWEAEDGTFHLLVLGNCRYHAFSQDGRAARAASPGARSWWLHARGADQHVRMRESVRTAEMQTVWGPQKSNAAATRVCALLRRKFRTARGKGPRRVAGSADEHAARAP